MLLTGFEYNATSAVQISKQGLGFDLHDFELNFQTNLLWDKTEPQVDALTKFSQLNLLEKVKLRIKYSWTFILCSTGLISSSYYWVFLLETLKSLQAFSSNFLCLEQNKKTKQNYCYKSKS